MSRPMPAYKTFQGSKDVPISQRGEKPNHRLSQVTNFAKSVLIARVARGGLVRNVLDLGCGRGSDASKFARVGAIYYCGVAAKDFAPSRIVQAQDRRSQGRQAAPIACDFHANTMEDFLSNYSKSPKFDVASSFNAMHHTMWDIGAAQTMLHSLNAALVSAGYLVGIMPNAEAIRQHTAQRDGTVQQATWKFVCNCTQSAPPCTCSSYDFTLPGSFEAVKEPFVDWDRFETMLLSAGFSVESRGPLSEFATRARLSREDSQLWRSMKMNSRNSISDSENMIFDMYTCFIAKKAKTSEALEELNDKMKLATLRV